MRLHHLLALVVGGSSAIAVWACGSSGDANTDLLGQNDSGTTSSSGATSSGNSSGSSGNADASGGGDGGPDGSSSGAPGGDGGIDPPDAGPGGDLTKVTCGATSCSLPAEQCCVAEVPGPGNNAYACISGDAGCPPIGGGDVTALKCSSQANCPTNTVCCVRQTNSGATSDCRASCSGNEAQLCDPNATTTGCPAQDPCSNNNIGDWGLPDTYATCGGKGN